MLNDMTPQRPRQPHQRPNLRTFQQSGTVRTATPRPDHPPTPTKKPTISKKTVEIRLLLPHIGHHPLITRARDRFGRTSRKQRIILALAVVLLLGACGYFATRHDAPRNVVTTGSENPLDKLQKGTPDYPTILPAGKSIKDLGGWTRISPPEREPVYAYVDKIGTVNISVSQQPLPDSFSKDPDGKVKELATSQSADKTVTIDGKKAYIGTSENGPQSVIYNTDTLLILLKSTSVISDQEWQKYIQSLG